MSWGPWTRGMSEVERRAQLRALRSLVGVIAGPVGRDTVEMLARAEHDLDALERAREMVEALPTLSRRRILSSFGAWGMPARKAS